VGPDEQLARDLDDGAAAARRRGGLAAVAAFRTRAAHLTPGRQDKVGRLFAAAEAMRDAGAIDEASELLGAAIEIGADDRETGRILRLRGQLDLIRGHPAEAAEHLLRAGAVIAKHDPALANEVHLEALSAAVWTPDDDPFADPAAQPAADEAPDSDGRSRSMELARLVPPGAVTGRADDVVPLILDGLRALVVTGIEAAAPAIGRAVDLILADPAANRPTAATYWPMITLPLALWDEKAWLRMPEQIMDQARRDGALAVLPAAQRSLAVRLTWAGELDAAADAVAAADEADRENRPTRGAGRATDRHARLILAAWRGDEAETGRLAAEIRDSLPWTTSPAGSLADYAEAVLHNGSGRFELAHAAARLAFDVGRIPMGTLAASELADAAARAGAAEDLRRLDSWMQERVRAVPGMWVLGLAERVRALLAEETGAEALYQSSIDHLAKTASGTERARSELLYGEWLRGQGRRYEARHILRGAHRRFQQIGAQAFAERALRSLRAVGDPAVTDVGLEYEELTAQEAQIAKLAAEGLTNPEIGARLFISRRTVQYHLRKVFLKLGITSRSQLTRSPRPDHLVPEAGMWRSDTEAGRWTVPVSVADAGG
jgi:DNA-binding CsgD family transcriptional regulator